MSRQQADRAWRYAEAYWCEVMTWAAVACFLERCGCSSAARRAEAVSGAGWLVWYGRKQEAEAMLVPDAGCGGLAK